jgi:hypothetical protein
MAELRIAWRNSELVPVFVFDSLDGSTATNSFARGELDQDWVALQDAISRTCAV